jgi:hypothetical protein
MAIKLVLENLDTVDESLKSLYVEHTDGKFHLDTDADSVKTHKDVSPLSNAYNRTKDELTRVKNEYTAAKGKLAPDDFDPEIWEKAKSGKFDETAVSAKIAEVRKAMEGEVNDWKGKYTSLESKLRDAAVESSLTSAIAASGITNPVFATAAKLMVKSKITFEGDSPLIDIGLGPMPLDEGVKRWAGSEEGKAFIQPATGDSAKGNTQGNKGSSGAQPKLNGTKEEQAAYFAAKHPELAN